MGRVQPNSRKKCLDYAAVFVKNVKLCGNYAAGHKNVFRGNTSSICTLFVGIVGRVVIAPQKFTWQFVCAYKLTKPDSTYSFLWLTLIISNFMTNYNEKNRNIVVKSRKNTDFGQIFGLFTALRGNLSITRNGLDYASRIWLCPKHGALSSSRNLPQYTTFATI